MALFPIKVDFFPKKTQYFLAKNEKKFIAEYSDIFENNFQISSHLRKNFLKMRKER